MQSVDSAKVSESKIQTDIQDDVDGKCRMISLILSKGQKDFIYANQEKFLQFAEEAINNEKKFRNSITIFNMFINQIKGEMAKAKPDESRIRSINQSVTQILINAGSRRMVKILKQLVLSVENQ